MPPFSVSSPIYVGVTSARANAIPASKRRFEEISGKHRALRPHTTSVAVHRATRGRTPRKALDADLLSHAASRSAGVAPAVFARSPRGLGTTAPSASLTVRAMAQAFSDERDAANRSNGHAPRPLELTGVLLTVLVQQQDWMQSAMSYDPREAAVADLARSTLMQLCAETDRQALPADERMRRRAAHWIAVHERTDALTSEDRAGFARREQALKSALGACDIYKSRHEASTACLTSEDKRFLEQVRVATRNAQVSDRLLKQYPCLAVGKQGPLVARYIEARMDALIETRRSHGTKEWERCGERRR